MSINIRMINKKYSTQQYNLNGIETEILIPAYNSAGKGLIVNLKLKAKYSENLFIEPQGIVANALSRNLNRCIEIMSSINEPWEILKHFSYQLECTNNNFKVSDARSSSLALSIALLNIYREINNSHQIKNITGTGVLRIDGSFEETYLEQQKYSAVKKSEGVEIEFITSSKCNHLFELEILLDQYKHKGKVVCQ